MIHTIKGLGVVNKAEVDVFLQFLCFFDKLKDVGNLISDSSAFYKSSLNIWKFTVHILWTLAWRILSISLRVCAAAAAAKSLQSCPTLCDPIDGSPPGSAVPGILQARTLEWIAISFSNAGKWKVKVKSLSHVWLFVTPWTVAYQAPPSKGFSRQEHWSGLPLPSPASVWDECNCAVVWIFLALSLWDWNENWPFPHRLKEESLIMKSIDAEKSFDKSSTYSW